MTQRPFFKAKMVESFGGPLMAAITASPVNAESPGKVAATMAELVNRSVQLGVALADYIGLKSTDEESDSVRLALASLSSYLVASMFRQSGQTPGEGDIRRMLPALEAVLTFSDRFLPAAETAMRIENLEPGSGPADEDQVTMQYIQALVPVVTEISAYSFGRPDRKLAREVSDRLLERTEAMCATMFPALPEGRLIRRLQLGLLKGLAMVYVECHKSEKARIQSSDETERPGEPPSLDPLWTLFDERAAMLEIMAAGLANTRTGKPPLGDTTGESAAPVSAVKDKPAEPATPIPEKAPAAPQNPMAFFKPGQKKAASSEKSDSGAW